MSITRIAAAVLLAMGLFAVPARADGSHVCFAGSRTVEGEYYKVYGSGCDGVGYYQATVTIRFGPVGGTTYLCSGVIPWNSDLVGNQCVLTSGRRSS